MKKRPSSPLRYAARAVASVAIVGGLAAGLASAQLAIETIDLPPAKVCTQCSATLKASGAVQEVLWSLAGQQPPGLELDPASGELAGQPTIAATYKLAVTAADRDASDLPPEFVPPIMLGIRP